MKNLVKFLVLLILLNICHIPFSVLYASEVPLLNISQGASYSSHDMYKLALQLESKYPYIIHVETIGLSVDQKPLYSILMTENIDVIRQRDDFKVYRQHYFIEAGTHARETVNPFIVMKQIEDYAIDYYHEDHIPEFSLMQELKDVVIHFLPLTNPDGFDLVKFGPSSIQNIEKRTILGNIQDTKYSNYKAGITGVDHNRNYPHEYFDSDQNLWVNLWQKHLNDFHSFVPDGEFYPGPHAASEPEVQAIMDYILSYDFRNYISFHSRGNLIYWNKYYASDEYNARTKSLAQAIIKTNGYILAKPDNGKGSGYLSDFTCAQTLKPLVTVETLSSKTDLPTPSHLYSQAYEENQLVPLYAIQEGKKIGYHKYRLYVDYTYVRDFEDLVYAQTFALKYDGEIIEGNDVPPMVLEDKKRAHQIYELLIKYLPLI